MAEWLHLSYQGNIVDGTSLHSSFATNRSYAGLKAPARPVEGGYAPDFQSRYLSENVPYGLLVTLGIAELVGASTPTLQEVCLWSQERLGKVYLEDGRLRRPDIAASRTPQRYGIERLELL